MSIEVPLEKSRAPSTWRVTMVLAWVLREGEVLVHVQLEIIKQFAPDHFARTALEEHVIWQHDGCAPEPFLEVPFASSCS